MKYRFLDKSDKFIVSHWSLQQEVMKNNPLGDSWYHAAMNNPFGDIPNNNPCQKHERQRKILDELFNEEFYKKIIDQEKEII